MLRTAVTARWVEPAAALVRARRPGELEYVMCRAVGVVKDSSGAWKLSVKPLAARSGLFRIPLVDAEHCSELVDFAVLGFFGAMVEVLESQAVFQQATSSAK